ncbi:unnamed protein product [Rotaria sordida]|uniref:Uncharacterized protein n=1 Tax=Rotaria sordida TaxID=392033 RepID=A0A815MLN0_9BILA|nr:unnamed protein product [Rotaria sordida]CAF1449474.1 unnamed protein product [Rotaria sordida]CAF4005272.1 unnamed protein product [Rotaria sordida]CAF4013775.1 unnamed protein product [Rotaria sordida]
MLELEQQKILPQHQTGFRPKKTDSMNEMPTHTEHGLFAFDTALWTSSNTISNLTLKLRQSIDEFQSWCNSWKLKL